MPRDRLILPIAGAVAASAIALAADWAHGPPFIASLAAHAGLARDGARGGTVTVDFVTPQGWLTRHPTLRGGTGLDDAARTRIAAAIAAVPGMGGVSWAGAGTHAQSPQSSGHCQEDVEAILKSRTVRFTEASAAIDPQSATILDEVAAALRPCAGGTIAITGHTDNGGDEPANLALSQARAEAVRWALVARGIRADGIRTAGKGSSEPLAGLTASDPANRRIEFSVIERQPIRPTVVDTPGPG